MLRGAPCCRYMSLSRCAVATAAAGAAWDAAATDCVVVVAAAVTAAAATVAAVWDAVSIYAADAVPVASVFGWMVCCGSTRGLAHSLLHIAMFVYVC